jgi:16S rRNA (guanine966-N2)-methyltransferase
MRIVGGTARGRPLRARLPATVRPTTDRAREAIFSMLESANGVRDLVVADLYCGSGAMGLEAMSRGARRVYFVDEDRACTTAARANLDTLGLHGEAEFVVARLPGYVIADDVDLVVADPPYGPLDVAALLGATSAHRAVIENDHHATAPEGWQVTRQKRYGTTLVTMLESTRGDRP